MVRNFHCTKAILILLETVKAVNQMKIVKLILLSVQGVSGTPACSTWRLLILHTVLPRLYKMGYFSYFSNFILSSCDPVSHHSVFKIILTLSSHLQLWFSFIFSTKILYAFFSSPVTNTCPTNLILLNLITLIICDDEYKIISPILVVKVILITL